MDGLIGISGVLALLIGAGALFGLARPRAFHFPWLLAAAGLVLLNDALLTNLYGLLPDGIGGDWNWQGKALTLLATLAVAALPVFGWRASGLTLVQAPGSLKPALAAAVLYMGVFLCLALAFPGGPTSTETIAFQLTMPGFEEEPFYRGVLLLALMKAFTDRVRFLGVEWSLGALLSCVLFGLAHAFNYSDGRFGFDPLTMVLTAVPSLLGVWLALRTRSLLIPVVLHNFGNAITLLL